MNYRETSEAMASYRRQIAEIREKMRAVQSAVEPEPVADFTFSTPDGPVTLTALFGDRPDLIVVHNMGKSCPSCTMWADGFNGIYHHLANRAAVAVSSPDPPIVQRDFAAGRGWRFPMVSHAGTNFAADMGYRGASGDWLPGVSVFRRDGARILRVAETGFHPDDDFCAMWHFLGLLPNGADGWRPRHAYE